MSINPNKSLVGALSDYVRSLAEKVVGKKYYAVLLAQRYWKIKGSERTHPIELTSSIFHSRQEAEKYIDDVCPGDVNDIYSPVAIVEFRTKYPVPYWSPYVDQTNANLEPYSIDRLSRDWRKGMHL